MRSTGLELSEVAERMNALRAPRHEVALGPRQRSSGCSLDNSKWKRRAQCPIQQIKYYSGRSNRTDYIATAYTRRKNIYDYHQICMTLPKHRAPDRD